MAKAKITFTSFRIHGSRVFSDAPKRNLEASGCYLSRVNILRELANKISKNFMYVKLLIYLKSFFKITSFATRKDVIHAKAM